MELKIIDNIDSINKITVTAYNCSAINSIKERYKEDRQKSKAPTFALT